MRTVLVLCSLLAASLVFVSCGGDECVAGVACTCSSDCDETCGGTGGSCSFTCTGGSCNFSCPGGGCGATGTNATSVVLDCPGNSCSLSCTGTATCKITGCTVGCSLNCGGAATCSSSCTPLAGGCATTK